MPSYSPFWFAKEDLLTDLLRAEIHSIKELFARHPDLREFFDIPEATTQQRAACFALLAQCELVEEISETFTERWRQSPSLGAEEKDVLARTRQLFDDDAPAWVLEVNKVAELLPSRIYDALPEPLRRGGFHSDDAAQVDIISSAATKLSSVQEIQTLSKKVLDHQQLRLERRWAAARPVANLAGVQGRAPTKRKDRRRRDKQRMSRDKLIAEIDALSPTVVEFLKVMDERKVKHQPTWSGWPGSWVEAYKNLRLRKLIHQDKSRAIARARPRPNR